MSQFVLPKGVKRITFLQPPREGDEAPETITIPGRRKKKISRGFRLIERMTRRYARATETLSVRYLARHDRSNRKKRDGWLRDYVFNMLKANQAAMRELRLPVIKL